MIKSASFGTKKNLIDSVTNTERENPKQLTEGEKEENYFVLAFKDNSEFEIILQNTHLGITSNHFKNYLDKFINKYLSTQQLEKNFNTMMGDIIIDDPNELIAQLDRIVECKVYMDKEVLGSDFLKLSNRTLQVIKDLIDEGEFEVGFMLYPSGINEIKALADNNLIMPPKSTYIEPKFRSGLVVYEL
jgi:uncharacterized protein (DUF1015 family)